MKFPRTTPHALRRSAGLATAVLGLSVAAAPAQAALTAFGPVDPATHFPAWYQDANGLKLAPCPASTANCPVAPAAGAIPSTYANAIGRFLTAGPAHNGRIDLQEFITGVTAVPGGAAGGLPQPVTEAKLVISASGLVPNSTYNVVYPYGTTSFATDATGAVPHGKASVLDFAGCLAIAGPFPPPCNFGAAMAGVVGPFLRQDPHVAPPPAGFIGSSLIAEPIVGSPMGTNYVQIDGPNAGGIGVNTIKTNKFFVTGKLAPGALVTPLASAPLASDLGSTLVGTTTATKTITVSNDATVPLALSGMAITGPNAGDFALTGGTCPAAGNVAPAPGAPGTCTVTVSFTPTAQGARSATLNIADNVAAGPLTVALTGAGTVPAAPAPAPPVVAAIAPSKPSPLAIGNLIMPHNPTLRRVRKHGLPIVVFAPQGAKLVRIRLLRGSKQLEDITRKVKGDGVLTLDLASSRKARRSLKRGSYVLLVTPERSATDAGVITRRTLRIR
jgi:hypothetical protein